MKSKKIAMAAMILALTVGSGGKKTCISGGNTGQRERKRDE